MELIAVLVLLYGIQCLTWLPRGSVLVVESWLGGWTWAGPGFRLLHPLPSARCWRAARLPLREDAGALHGRGAVTWLSARDAGALPVALEALRDTSAENAVVRVGGRPFARGGDAADALRIAAWLRALAEVGASGAAALLDAELARATSLAGFQSARARYEHGARWLGVFSDAYCVCLFVLLPAGMLLTASEYALRFLLPALVALHLGCWIALARAHRRLFPERRGDRWKLLIETSLYPPSLLRAQQALRYAAVASFHPAAVAAGALPRERARDFLRAEWLRAQPQDEPGESAGQGLELSRREARALRELVRELGDSPDALLAAPARSDPHARSYCPACRCEYRVEAGACPDCALPLQAFAQPHVPITASVESR